MEAHAEVAEPGGARDRPLRRDAERNRQRILAAAAELLSERGLDATLDDVARAAGVGVGALYRRYPSKEALLQTLCADGSAMFITVESSTTMSCAIAMTMRISQRRGSGSAEAPAQAFCASPPRPAEAGTLASDIPTTNLEDFIPFNAGA